MSKPNDQSAEAPDKQPASGLPLGPISREELLRQDAERAAAMQAKLEQACKPAPTPPPGNNKLGARKGAKFKAICTAPSINWTPAGSGKVPVPYQTVQDLSNSMNTARTVRFNGLPVYLLDQTTQPKGTGDERGTGKGIRSGTVTGEVKPVSGCKNVRIESKHVVRAGDECTMNGGNNPGIYVTCEDKTGKLPFFVPMLQSELPVLRGYQVSETSQFDQATRMDMLARLGTIPALSELKYGVKGPRLVAWDPRKEEAQLAKTRNRIATQLLQIFGGAGALAQLLKEDDSTVASANELGAAAFGVVTSLYGLPSHRSASTNVVTKMNALPTQGSRGTGVKIAGAEQKINIDPRVQNELNALQSLSKRLGGIKPGPGERSLTKQQYRTLISQYRNKGDVLKRQLIDEISSQDYVYRATNSRMVEIYRANGKISGRNGEGVYMTTEYVGLNPRTIMEKSQVFPHWGAPDVLLKIPKEVLSTAEVPRPLGGKSPVGWEPRTEAYPAAGQGGMQQFLGATKTWDDRWVIPLTKPEKP